MTGPVAFGRRQLVVLVVGMAAVAGLGAMTLSVRAPGGAPAGTSSLSAGIEAADDRYDRHLADASTAVRDVLGATEEASARFVDDLSTLDLPDQLRPRHDMLRQLLDRQAALAAETSRDDLDAPARAALLRELQTLIVDVDTARLSLRRSVEGSAGPGPRRRRRPLLAAARTN